MIYFELRQNYVLVFIFLVMIFGCTVSPRATTSACKLCGEYRATVSEGMVYQVLKLSTDGSFSYERGTDLISKKSIGTWRTDNDTILSVNKFQTRNFDLSVTERLKDTNFVDFGFVTNLKGEIIHDALIQINGSAAFYDVLARDYHVAPDSLKSFRIVIGPGYISNTYRVLKAGSTHFNIQLPLNETTVNYFFSDTSKFLVSRDGQYLSALYDSLRNQNNGWQWIRLNKVK